MDITAPVIKINDEFGPGPGSYIAGAPRIYISATDDRGIRSVSFTYTYRTAGPDGKLTEQPPVTIPARFDSDKKNFFVDFDTTGAGMADGSVTVEITAQDKSGKTARSDKLIYIVKNTPPALELQVPKPKKDDSGLNNTEPLPVVITDNYLTGIYQDLAGVAKGYPLIQFWPDEDGTADPPATDGNNAGWGGVTAPFGDDDGWIPVDQGLVTDDKGEKGNAFRYYLRKHQADGSPGDEQNKQQLAPGKYSLRIKTRDIMGKEAIWPQDAYANKPGRIRMELLATGTPPLITVHGPDSLYQRTDFTISASAEPRSDVDTDILEMSFEVPGKNKNGETKTVTLKTWPNPGIGVNGVANCPIVIGKTYYNAVPGGNAVMVDNEASVPAGAFSFVTFTDGAYNFVLRATSYPTNAPGHEQLSLYIDRTPPAVSVTQVKPFFSQDDISLTNGVKGPDKDKPNNTPHTGTAPDPYRRWTVNSTVNIEVSSADNRGNTLEKNGYMKFKYLLLKNNDIDEGEYAAWRGGDSARTFGHYLYEGRGEAKYFDEVKDNPVQLNPAVPGNTNPLVRVSGGDGVYTLTLQTQYFDGGGLPYKLWLYIVSRDNAGNTSYAKALLNVDQGTDNPVVKFGNLNPENSLQGLSFVDETTAIRAEATDDDGLNSNSAEYRFAKKHNGADKEWSHPDDDTPWFPVTASLSADKLSMSVQGISLKKISCDLKGHTYDDSHPIHQDVLGSETDTKAIQIRVRDDIRNKALNTDGIKTGKTAETRFTMDLTWPEITVSAEDNGSPPKPISRDAENPFVDPRKDGAYQKSFIAYGDLSEKNLLSFTVVIDGEHKIRFTVPDPVPGTEPPLTQPLDNSLYAAGGTGKKDRPVPAVWKNKNSRGGELRWRFPLNYEVPAVFNAAGNTVVTPAYVLWDKLKEGTHTFMLQAEDRVPRTASKQITFYKDSRGPAVNLITLNKKVYLSDAELEDIKKGNLSAALNKKLDDVKAMTIKEGEAKIIGTFTDEFSAVNTHFWYRIDQGPWTRKDLAAPGKTAAWELALPASGAGAIGDGIHRLSVRAADSLGNGYGFDGNSYADTNPANGPGSETGMAFILDRKDPALVILSPYGDKDTDERVYAYKTAGEAAGTEVIAVKGLAGDSSLRTADPVIAAIDGLAAPAEYMKTQALNWRGSRADASLVSSPALWDGYHNTTSGTYFIYNGSVWETLGPADSKNPYRPDEGETTLFWTFSLTAARLDGAVNKNGAHKIAFSVKDSTGREVTKVWNFIRDNAPPDIDIINGVPGSYSEDKPVIVQNEPKIQGTVSDRHGSVVKLEALLEKKNSGRWEIIQPAAGRDWEELAVNQGRWLKDLSSRDDGQYRITIRSFDSAMTGSTVTGNTQTLGALNFIIDTASPVISAMPAIPFRNGAFALSGMAADKNSVIVSAALDGGNITGIPAPVQKGAENYEWSFTVPLTASTAEGSHTVTVTATDKAGRTDTKMYNFTYDKTPPDMSIAAPGAGSKKDGGGLGNGAWAFYDSGVWINGLVDIRGTSTDTNGIARISYYLGKIDGSADGNESTGGDGETLYAGIKETNNPATGWTDTGLHTGSPASGWHGGVYSWTLTENFNAYASVTGKVINNTAPGNADTAANFYLPLYVRAEDVAGNIRVLHYNLWVDPDLDKPQVSISNPGNNATVGGEVRISGTASDDDWVYGVQIRVKAVYDHDNNAATPDREAYYKNPGDNWINNETDGWIAAAIVGNTDKVTPWYSTINSDGRLNPPPGTLREVTIEARAQDTKDDSHQIPGETGLSKTLRVIFDSNVPTISNVRITRDKGSPENLTSGVRAGGKFTITADIQDEGGIASIKARETGDTGFRDMLTNPKSSWKVQPKNNAPKEYEISIEVDSTNPNLFPYGKTGNYSLELQVTDNNTSPAPYMTAATCNVLVDNYFPTAKFTTQYNAATRNFYISGMAEDYGRDSGSVEGLERILVYFERDGGFMNAGGTAFSGNPSYAQGKEGIAAADAPVTGINNFPVLISDKGNWKSNHAMVIDKQEIDQNTDTDKDGTYAEMWQDVGAAKKWQARFDTTLITDGPITVHYVIMDQAGNASRYTQDIYIRNNPPVIRQFILGTDLNGDRTSLENHAPVVVAVRSGDTVSFKQTAAIDMQFTARNYLLNFNLITFGGNGGKYYKVSRVEAGSRETDSTALAQGEVYTIKNPGNTDWTRLGAPNGGAGTTFVATGPAAAADDKGDPVSGTAVSYTAVSGTAKLVTLSAQDNTGNIRYEGTSDFAYIPDSIGSSAAQDKKLFLVKVYDSTNTAPGSGEKDQLAHAILLKLDIDNVDETPPSAGITPFHWNSEADNSLYESRAANGHIELEADLPAAFIAGGTGVMDRDPKVSGKISIRGTAFDNAMLKNLWINLDGFDFGVTPSTIKGRNYVPAAVYADGAWTGTDNLWETEGWKFTVDAASQIHDQSGHRVNWRLDIDTARIKDIAVADRVFRVLSRDGSSNDSAENDVQTAAGKETPYYRLDVVPYTTEVVTRLSAFNRNAPSVYARTARGTYPAADDDDVTVYGFNIGSAPSIKIKEVPFPKTETGQGKDIREPWQYVKIKLNNTSASGGLSLTVNGITALNNMNNNETPYNRQPNAVNNDNLTDDTALDVWQFTQVFKSRSESRYPSMKVGPNGEIGFSFANDYQWFNMPGYQADDTFSSRTFWSQTVYQRGWGGYSHNTFAFDARGNTYGAVLNIDEAGVAQSANFTFINRRPSVSPGSMNQYDNYTGTVLNTMRLENTTVPSNSSKTQNIVDVNRIQSPAMVTSMPYPENEINDTDNRVSVYLAYYDRTTGQVRFRAGTVGRNRSAAKGSDFTVSLSGNKVFASGHGLENGTEVYLRSTQEVIGIDRTRPYYVINKTANNFELTSVRNDSGKKIAFYNSTGAVVSVTGGGLADLSGYVGVESGARLGPVDANPSNYQMVASSGRYNAGSSITYAVPGAGYKTTYPGATKYGPGPHVAAGVVEAGGKDVVVLAWYDEVNNRLVYSWNDNPAGNSAGQWQTNAREIEDYAGEGVSLATDSDGGIHLAYYSADGADLKYAYAPSYSGAFKTVTVDAYLSVGTHSTITVAKDAAGREVPYISYYATGAAALRAKLAYRAYKDTDTTADLLTAGVNERDKFTGAWEVTTVPTQKVPTEYRINVGIWTDKAGNIQALPANSNGTVVEGSSYGGALPVDPATRLYGNGTLNPVVGYATTTNLEMAQKK
ncbi:MAG: Ig-like domain-containing protein [Treponema sp.]|nr:Ig-like domain-containing protein [Treponema sp.]